MTTDGNMNRMRTVGVVQVTRKGDGSTPCKSNPRNDFVATEEPLQIRIESEAITTTMRTPDHDQELVAGFLYAEGIIDGPDDIHAMNHVGDTAEKRANTYNVVLSGGVPAGRRGRIRREMFSSSACGVCGTTSIAHLLENAGPIEHQLPVDPAVLCALPQRLRTAQAVFSQTGGLHAAGLFHTDGTLQVVREDIGRHNTVDKVIGWRLLQGNTPINDAILVVSGRTGFEIIQKALVAKIPVVAALGAPSSFAVELAVQSGLTLAGFLHEDGFNLYQRE